MARRKVVLKGIIASPGRAQGRVRIVRSHKDLLKAGKKDIIVASFLLPDVCLAFRNSSRVAGIVTEKGGSTCHIAILAREFNIPYLAGARTATRRLRNNDLICLDAEQGVVYEI
jgi:pyruvate, water dikinase